MLKLKNTIGQSTVEYILLVTAIVVVMIFFLVHKGDGTMQGKLNETLSTVSGDIQPMGLRLIKASQPH